MDKKSYKTFRFLLIFVFIFSSGCTILSFLQGRSSSTSEEEAFLETATAIQMTNEMLLTLIDASATAAVANATATAYAELEIEFQASSTAIALENATRSILLTATAEADQGE